MGDEFTSSPENSPGVLARCSDTTSSRGSCSESRSDSSDSDHEISEPNEEDVYDENQNDITSRIQLKAGLSLFF